MKILGFDLEVPPGCGVLTFSTLGDALITDNNGELLLNCCSDETLEVFAATGLARWEEIISTEGDDEATLHAEKHAEIWREFYRHVLGR